MVKKILIVSILLLSTQLFAQQNLSVDLNDPVYKILDYIELRNYIKPLHNSRPYSLDFVLESLKESLSNSSEMSTQERIVIQDTIDRLQPKRPTDVTNGNIFSQIAAEGAYRYESVENGMPISVEIGANADLSLFSNVNEPSFSTDNWLSGYILGDLGENISYKINLGGGVMKLDKSAYLPYTFSPSWAGSLSYLSEATHFTGFTEEAAIGFQTTPELAASFYDNKINIQFSRIRRDWGTGNGNLMLSETAQPFAGFELNIKPTDFISLSTITGTLEYYNDNTIKPTDFQNSYSAFMGEINMGEYLYAAVTSSVVYPKRFELGYMIPVMIPFFYQNVIGDFDNLQMGFSLGAKIPKYANFYLNAFIDEIGSSDPNLDRNMFAYQAGLNVAIPNTPLVTFNLQYTKIEPYMYTHPGTQTPWYSSQVPKPSNPTEFETIRMHTNYVNHGESLGYNLPPNSDELKIVASATPFWFLHTNISYSLVRHGLEAYDETVDKLGNNLDDFIDYGDQITPGDPSDNNTTTKYFLTDGTYEWIHSLGINAQMDLRFIDDIPLELNLGYTLSFTHHTQVDVLTKSFKPINNTKYKDTWANYLTFSVKIY